MSTADSTFKGYNAAMQQHDLMVHLDEDGDPILEGVTPAGVEFCNGVRAANDIPEGEELMISMGVDDFIAKVPKELSVGFVSPVTGMTQKLCRPLLH
jgi:hypothetical protein